jgi:uncharacterized protein
MTSISAARFNLFSTISTGVAPPVRSRALFDLPDRGDTHLDHPVATERERDLWAAGMDQAVLRAEKPVLLIASGVTCLAAAWWARLSPGHYVTRIAGALLFDPLDPAEGRERPALFGAPPVPLPFPSVVVESRDGSAIPGHPTSALAQGWGSSVAYLPSVARRAGARWQAAHEALTSATSRIVERRMRVADALGIKR